MSGPARRTGTGALVAVAAALAMLMAAAPAAAQTDWLETRVMNIAHQGGENEAPSNTMYALRRAMRLGADMLEVDIHTSADGEIMVLHDATVDRTTNGSGRVYDMTAAEIQALDSAHNFVPGEGTRQARDPSEYRFRGIRTGERKPPPAFAPRDFRIPKLGEVMGAFPGVPINIEIKGAADADVGSFLRNAEALAAFLNDLGRTRGIIVASFNDAALEHFHSLAPQIDLAPATAAVAAYKAGRVPLGPKRVAFQVPIEFGGVPVTDRQFVADAHEDGYAVHVWTVNDEPTFRELVDWGVDGIMTAETGRLEGVLCADGVARPPRPRSIPGRHCNHRHSIACVVTPARLRKGKGARLRLTLRRGDQFAGRCAGIASLKLADAGRRLTRQFSFGKLPPDAGGPAARTVTFKARGKAARRAIRRGGSRVRVSARPYGAFVERARLPIR